MTTPEAKSDSTSYHFNDLTPDELERLAILGEECGEVMRAIGKILRHGYGSYNPDQMGHEGNRRELEKELGDLMGILTMMQATKDLDGEFVMSRVPAKIERILEYAHHQEAV